MPFRIVRNDITKLDTEAIVNTANSQPVVGPGCDSAVYEAAGYDELLAYREENIGCAEEGDAFITPGFGLPARYIIHAVSPLYIDGDHGEEEKLRSCYRKSLALAAEKGIRSIAFPLISTGSFGYPKEEGMRIAIDEIHAFLLVSDMDITLVVFDEKATRMSRNLFPDLETYIDRNYVEGRWAEEYGVPDMFGTVRSAGRADRRRTDERRRTHAELGEPVSGARTPEDGKRRRQNREGSSGFFRPLRTEVTRNEVRPDPEAGYSGLSSIPDLPSEEAVTEMERKLAERIAHRSDSFSQYLMYLIAEKGMENSDVYKRAIIDKKVFSKIKNNPDYHPQKLTALCLCIGAQLNLDESRDLLARAGYALSPWDKTDIIFSYFIEHGIYDMIELDIQLEEHGIPCIIQ